MSFPSIELFLNETILPGDANLRVAYFKTAVDVGAVFWRLPSTKLFWYEIILPVVPFDKKLNPLNTTELPETLTVALLST